MELIDTHAHIAFKDYDNDRESIISNAINSGLSTIVHPCCTLDEFPQLVELSQKYNGINTLNLFIALGVHPCNIDSWDSNSNQKFIDFLSSASKQNLKLRAIGETGLDYYHATDAQIQARQRDIFEFHIEQAQKSQLPLILHIRDAWEDSLNILSSKFKSNHNGRSGVLHCYTGDLDFALAAINLGFYISWSGILTFKKNNNFREIATQIPIEKTLIETDSPYLAPQAKRGQRNEPSFVRYIAETLADCYQISLEELAKITSQNAKNLFKI